MPTLVRLFVFLIVVAGLGFAGMIALTVMVDPGEKDVTIKIPTRDLVAASAPIDLGNLPAPVNVAPKDAPASDASLPSIDTEDSAASQPGVKTVDTGGE
ncbi:MAG: hypothetical protein ABI697_09550 [Devosia sp.]